MATPSGSYVFVVIVAAAGACSPSEPPLVSQAARPPETAQAPPAVPLDTALARLRSHSSAIRTAAAYTLAAPGPGVEARVEALGRALRDPDPGVGHAAASSLGTIGPASLPTLVKALSDSRATVRVRALYGLGKMGQRAAPAREAIRGALNDPDRAVRDMASWASGQTGPRTVAAALGSTADLASGLSAENPEERVSAIRRFQPFVADSGRSIRLLVRALGDPDPHVRSAAGDALVKLGSPATRTALTAALADPDPVVRREASITLVRLSALR